MAVALLPGGTSAFNHYIGEFEGRSYQMRIHSERFKKEAEEMGEYHSIGLVGMPMGKELLFEAGAASFHYSKQHDQLRCRKV
jgi:hypothetical protein